MKNLEYDAMTVMEQIQMAESSHMQMGALCSYLLQYPDMTIRDFFAMASEEIRERLDRYVSQFMQSIEVEGDND